MCSFESGPEAEENSYWLALGASELYEPFLRFLKFPIFYVASLGNQHFL